MMMLTSSHFCRYLEIYIFIMLLNNRGFVLKYIMSIFTFSFDKGTILVTIHEENLTPC